MRVRRHYRDYYHVFQGWMGKAEERSRVDCVVVYEKVLYGLRGCPWLSVVSRWLRAFFVVKRFHYKKSVVHYISVKYDLPITDIIMIGETVHVKGFYV